MTATAGRPGGTVRRAGAALALATLLAWPSAVPVAAASGIAVSGAPAAVRLAALVARARHLLAGGAPGAALAELTRAPRPAGPLLDAVVRDLRRGRTAAAARALAARTAALDRGRPPVPSAAAARRALRVAYADPGLRTAGAGSGGGGGGPAALLTWLRRWLRQLFGLLPRAAWAALGVAVLAAASGFALWRLRAAARGHPPPAPGRPGPPGTPDPEAAWRRAQAAAAAGRHREAVRHAFQAVLLTAARRHALGVDPAWTNAELLAAAAAVGALGPRLRPLVATFDRVVYGGDDPGADGWAAFAGGCRAAEAALG